MSFIKKLPAVALACALTLPIAGQYASLPVKQAAAAPDEYHDDWLHVNENAEIVDMDGNPVWLTGVNWFGYNVGSQIFDGAWSANVEHCLDLIADHGFNLLRVPMSTQILLQWKNGEPDPMLKLNEYENPELTVEGVKGGTKMYSFDIWNIVVKWCREKGIKIMMDIHCATTNSAGHNYPLWYDENYSEEDWLEALAWFADYYKDDDTIIAIDLKNEPHGKKDDGMFAKWDGSSDQNNWRYGAEKGAKACLDQNPDLLIVVEGIEVYPKFEKGFDWDSPSIDYTHYGDPNYDPYYGAWWGSNFRGAKEYPVDLGEYQSQLVYSPHDYGPLVYEQTWFHLEKGEYDAVSFDNEGKVIVDDNGDPVTTKQNGIIGYDFDRESLLDEYWRDTWAYLVEDNISPLLMGEWGGWTDEYHDPSGANRHWMEVLRDYMIEKHIHHTFWCFNENSSDTGGLMYDNFQKWDDTKYEFVKPALWQTADGKFISLDHTIPLGEAGNGISLGDYYSGGTQPVTTTKAATTTNSADTSTTTTTTAAVVTEDTPTSAEQSGDYLAGDANLDGKVNMSDVVLIMQCNANPGEFSLSDKAKANADVSGSGDGVTNNDALTIQRFEAGLIDKLPVDQ